MIEFTFDYEESHPDFIRLVSIENIIAQLEKFRSQSNAVIATLAILKRGQREGVVRSDIGAVDLHLMISAFCFFRVYNRHTFGALFRCELNAPDQRRKHKRIICEAIIRVLEVRQAHSKATRSRADATRVRSPFSPRLAAGLRPPKRNGVACGRNPALGR
jgi:hypothetical protein